MQAGRFRSLLFSGILVLCGLAAVPFLSFSFLPQNSDPAIQIDYSYPGADPEQLEFVLTRSIEAAVSRMPFVKKIESRASQNYGYTRIIFDSGTDIDYVRFEILSVLRQIYPSWPREVAFPGIRINNSKQEEIQPILLVYSMNAPLEPSELYQYTLDHVIPQLSVIPGLERVDLSGGNEKEWQIRYNRNRMESLGLHAADIKSLLRRQMQETPLSYQMFNGEHRYLKISPAPIIEWADRPIRTELKTQIPLSEIADIAYTESRPLQYFRINGANSIRMSFIPQHGANHLMLARAIRDHIFLMEPQLPDGYFCYLEYDTTEFIHSELDKIKIRTLWSVVFLFLIVALAYRRIAELMALSYGLVVNLAVSVLLYHLFAIQLNLYGMAAFTVSFGIIVDNAIVMTHHYRRTANRRVFPALVTASTTTLAAMVVLFFLPENMKLELFEFARVLAINLSVSLAVCYFVIPTVLGDHSIVSENFGHSSLKGDPESRIYRAYNGILDLLYRHRRIASVGLILLFGLPVFLLPSRWQGQEWYNKSFGSDFYIERIKPWVDKSLGGSWQLFARKVYEGNSFRSSEETKLYVMASMPMGSTLEQMNEVIRKIESYLSKYKGSVKSFVSRVSSGESGSVDIRFDDKEDKRFPYLLKNNLESFASNMGGVKWNIYGIGKAFSTGGNSSPPRFALDLKGYNRNQLSKYADEFANILKKHPRISEVNTEANRNWFEKERYQYKLYFDYLKLARNKLNQNSLLGILQEYNARPAILTSDPQNIPVRIYDRDLHTIDMWQLNNFFRTQASGIFAPGQFADLKKVEIAGSIYKEDQQYIQRMEFEYAGSARFGQKYLDECLAAFRPRMRLGYSINEFQFNSWQNSKRIQYSLLALVILLIYILCAIHFESLRRALLIILLAPLSFIGIFLTFYCGNYPFDQGGYISFLLVSGLSVNSLILLFSEWNRLRDLHPQLNGLSLYKLALTEKFTPILISVLSTVFGILPFTLYGSKEVFWFSLAVGTMSGLLFSLLVVLFVVPLFIGKEMEKRY